MDSCIRGCIGIIFNGCMGNIGRGVRDEAEASLINETNEHVQPKLRECVENVMKWLFKFLKKASRLICGLSDEIQTVEEKHLKDIEDYLNNLKFDATSEERQYKANIIYIRRCFRESIDSFHLLQQQRNRLYDEGAHQASNTWGKIKQHFQVAVLCFKQLKQRFDIASTVIEMIEKLPAERDLHNHYIIKPKNLDPRRLFAAKAEDLVGLDGPKSRLIKLLDLEMQVHKGVHLVAVVGQGGVGKTTLVQKVYDQFKDRFQMCAWVTLSQSYDLAGILKQILTQFLKPENFPDEWNELGEDMLTKELNNFLSRNTKKSKEGEESSHHLDKGKGKLVASHHLDKGKRKFVASQQHSKIVTRYIVVVDDVWDNRLKDFIHYALAFGEAANIEGRILITTRDEVEIANPWAQKFGGEVFVHHPLSEADAMHLLSKKLKNCEDQQKKRVLDEILRKFPLLPLTILALAGVLGQKPDDLAYWNTVRDHLRLKFRGTYYEDTKRILLYSYHVLPEELKSCFLYFGMFPEDHNIDVSELLRIWIADGLIKRQSDDGDGYTPEEVAQKHMDTLVDRGLVMMTRDHGNHGLNSLVHVFNATAKVHDIFHQIIRDESQNDHFSKVVFDYSYDSSTVTIDGKFERLSVFCGKIDPVNFVFTPSNGRRCHSFRSVILDDSKTIDNLVRLPRTATRYLRVLHMEYSRKSMKLVENVICRQIPKEVGYLQNLRLLSLTISYRKPLPGFICELVNLETLDILNESLFFGVGDQSLPRELTRLGNLRHLIINVLVHVPPGVVESLTQLHTLGQVNASQPGLLQELKKLRHLRTLRVHSLKGADFPTFWGALMYMAKLRSLEVLVSIEHAMPDFNPMSIQCSEEFQYLPLLEKLKLQFSPGSIKELDFGTVNKFKNLWGLVIIAKKLGRIEGELPSLQRLYIHQENDDGIEIPSEHIREKIVPVTKG